MFTHFLLSNRYIFILKLYVEFLIFHYFLQTKSSAIIPLKKIIPKPMVCLHQCMVSHQPKKQFNFNLKQN